MTDNNHRTRIGAFVLETLTTGMYRYPLDTLREYVQNAFDSIRAGEREGILKTGAGRIKLLISEQKRTLTFSDNGTGVVSSEVQDRLVNIGMSAKNLEDDAGFRGIGRLAGIAYCDKLVFRTQGYGDKKISTVSFDSKALREAMSPKNRQIEEMARVIDKYVTVSTEIARNKEHFFEVSMQDINLGEDLFLSSKEVRTYLEQVAPIPIDTQSFHYSKTFYDWVKKNGIELPEVNLILSTDDTTYELFKPYKKITYSTAQGGGKVNIKGIRFFPEKVTKDSPFWIWYADTNCPGIIGKDTVAGLRLRKSNISIGFSERMTEIFRLCSESYARFNRYFMGEIHIQDPNIIPNAHRDDFENTPEWTKIKKELVSFARERSLEAYSLSNGRNADIDKLLRSANKHLNEVTIKQKTGLASKTEKDKLKKDIDKQISKLEAAEKADRTSKEKNSIGRKIKELKNAGEIIEKEMAFTGQKLKPSLDKKQRKIVSDIIEILYDVLETSHFETARKAILDKYQIIKKNS